MKYTKKSITLNGKSYDATQADYDSYTSETGSITMSSKTYKATMVKGLEQSGPVLDPVFGNNSWENIRTAFMTGIVPSSWQLGDTKSFTTISGNTYTVRLCDMKDGRYAYSDGSGRSKCVLELVELYKLGEQTYWAIDSTNRMTLGWGGSSLRLSVMPNIILDLPTDFLQCVNEVNVHFAASAYGGTILDSSDKVFLACNKEITNLTSYGYTGEDDDYGQFEYYSNISAINRTKNIYGTTTAKPYWLRSGSTSSVNGLSINASGNIERWSCSYNAGVGAALFFAI